MIFNKKRIVGYIIKVMPLFVIIFFFVFTANYPLAAQDFEKLRINMVEEQLKTRNIQSEAVLAAMRTVPRHLFVPRNMQSYAYNDSPLPIGR